MKRRRFARVIEIRPEVREEYSKLHAEIWPEVASMIKQAHLENYSIYLHEFPDGRCYLFSYFEYTGNDFDADIKAMATCPRVKEWGALCSSYQLPLGNRNEGEWWSSMSEVFYQK